MNPSMILACVGISGVVASIGYLVIHADDYEHELNLRLRENGASKIRRRGKRSQEDAGSTEVVRTAPTSSGMWNRFVPRRNEDRDKHQSRLLQAGIYAPTALSTYFAAKLGLMLAPPLAAIVIATPGGAPFNLSILVGCIGGVIGMLLPSFWIDRRIRQRHSDLRRAVPDMLDLMTVCLEGGLSLQGTLQRVGDELGVAHSVLACELAIVQREIELGVPVHAALRRLAVRTGYDGLRRLSTCVREAQRQGSDLADALRVHSDTLRDQCEAEGEEAAQKASVKILIPTLLFIFPAVFVVLAGPAAIRIHESFSQSSPSDLNGK